MLTKYKKLKRLDPEKSVNKLFENVSCQRRIQNCFYQGRAPNFVTFSSAFFPAELILSNLSHKNDSGVVWGHAPPENF